MPSEDIPEWEMPEEEAPEKLRKKWDSEELEEKPAVTCPACKKRVPADSFRCIYCGERVFKDSGLLGKILKWVRFGR